MVRGVEEVLPSKMHWVEAGFRFSLFSSASCPVPCILQASVALSSCSSCPHLLRIDVLRMEGTMTTTRNNAFLVRMERSRDPQSSPGPPIFSNSHLTSATSNTTLRCILRPRLDFRSSLTNRHRPKPSLIATTPISSQSQKYDPSRTPSTTHASIKPQRSLSATVQSRDTLAPESSRGLSRPEYHAFQRLPSAKASCPYAWLLLERVCQRGGCRSGLADQNMKTCV